MKLPEIYRSILTIWARNPGESERDAALVNKKESLIGKVNVSFAALAFFACYRPLCESA
jgi:hypothetical protein